MRPVPFPHPGLPTRKTQPAPLILTPKDEAILQAFATYRFLTSQEIIALFYKKGSKTYARARCSRLAGNKDVTDDDLTYGYPLLRFGFPTGHLGNQERIYCLSATGAAIIRERGHSMPWFIKPAKLRTFSHSYLLHDLTRNRLVVSLLTWAKTKPTLIVESHLSYELAKTPAPVAISVQGKMVNVAVVPDGLVLMTNTRTRERVVLLVEVDRNTQAVARIRTHIAARLAYVQSQHFRNTYGDIPYRIVYVIQGVTPSASRARLASMCACTMGLLTVLRKQEYARFVRFTTINFSTLYEDASRLFEAPSWYRPDNRTTPIPLLIG